MKKMTGQKIQSIEQNSIAWELGLEPGDYLLSINDKEIKDVFDYQFLADDEYLVIIAKKANGEEWELEIEKDYDEDLGIDFTTPLMDNYKSCHNKCIFCFIDQMPSGMRETLYFKDDDTRLSFLQGNYVTLTNISAEDLNRIIEYKLAPINISVHATDAKVRCQMLNNRFASDILEKIKKLSDHGIPMNSQIVLCKGINDGKILEKTIEDLSRFHPQMESLSVVPIGLTKHREKLFPLEPFYKEEARAVLDLIHQWQAKLKKEIGNRFVHASDEWFCIAGLPFPDEEYYEGYGQLENGVGMMRLFISEFEAALKEIKGDGRVKTVSIATAKLAYQTVNQFAGRIMEKFPNVTINVYCIINHFFGETITVTGLLTAGDIIAQLQGKALGDVLLLPENVLKADEEIFLDDITLEELQKTLQLPVDIVKSSGQDFIAKVLDSDEGETK